MLKTILFIIVLGLSQCLLAGKIMKIGNKTINEEDIEPSKKQLTFLLRKNTSLSPDIQKEITEKMKGITMKIRLSSLVNKFLFHELEKKFFSQVVVQQDIDNMQDQMPPVSKNKIPQYQALLKAIDYVNKSKDKNKYKMAYEKYLKSPLVCSYDSFKKNCENKLYVDFIKRQIRRAESGTAIPVPNSAVFMAKLPDYVLMKRLQDNPQEAEEIKKLSPADKRRFKFELYQSWVLQEAKNMGYELYTNKYGNDLKEIIWPPIEQYQKELTKLCKMCK